MSEITGDDAARIIRALTLQFPKVAQRLSVSKASGHILVYLKAKGDKSFIEICDELNMRELHAHRVLSKLERSKYVTITGNNKYRMCEE